VRGTQYPYRFVSVNQLMADFFADIEAARDE
jgi:hypothetical protein